MKPEVQFQQEIRDDMEHMLMNIHYTLLVHWAQALFTSFFLFLYLFWLYCNLFVVHTYYLYRTLSCMYLNLKALYCFITDREFVFIERAKLCEKLQKNPSHLEI